jgi:predicted RNase H-like HicB family nuclease
MVILPDELTAANGAKSLLIGEFKETVRVSGEDISVDVSWMTIKEIYKKIVEHFLGGEIMPTVIWSDDDQGYIATIPGIEGLSAFGVTRKEALGELEIAKEAFSEVLNGMPTLQS